MYIYICNEYHMDVSNSKPVRVQPVSVDYWSEHVVPYSSHLLDPLSPSWYRKLSTQRSMNEEIKFEHDPAMGVEYMKTMKKLAVASLLPKSKLVAFDGYPLRYYIFIKSFEANVEKYTDDYCRWLQLLIQFCVG